MKSDKLKIEIWSDVQCPFCYIGKRKFEQALETFEHKDSISVVWKSFQLNPQLVTDTSISTSEYLAKHKNISVQEAKAMGKHVEQAGTSAGLNFNFDTAIVANTHKAHQLLHLATKHLVQNELKEKLFEAHFENGKNIDDKEVLLAVGQEVGLKENDVLDALSSQKYFAEVEQDIKEAQQLGIRGVPYFVFDRKHALSGAHDPETFKQALNTSFADWQKENKAEALDTIKGDACEIDGGC